MKKNAMGIHVACIEDTRYAYNILQWKVKEWNHAGDKYSTANNIKMDLKNTG
jgi:hypothetical protein